jgi:excinuclease UvrABC helicase subunit UvrB
VWTNAGAEIIQYIVQGLTDYQIKKTRCHCQKLCHRIQEEIKNRENVFILSTKIGAQIKKYFAEHRLGQSYLYWRVLSLAM